MRMALQLIKEREFINKVSGIFLLSDSQERIPIKNGNGYYDKKKLTIL